LPISKIDSGAIKSLPDDTPTEFIDYKIKNAIQAQDGALKRSLWEVGVAMAIKDAFRSGNIFIPHSNKHVSFWDLVYNKEHWEREKPEAYQQLSLNQDVKKLVNNLVTEFHTTAKKAAKNFGLDGFAEIVNSKLKLRKKDKYDPPPEVKRLQAIINSYLPKIKIERLLIEVDKMTGFTRHLVPIHGQKSRPKNFYKTLIAGILSQATNIGMVTMQNCTTGITIDMLRHVVDACVYEETIKNSNAEIVNQHSVMTLSQVHGDGTFSSSDGQRFAVTASSLLSSYYPRYYGYYEKVINIYTHTSNQFSVYNTNAISCAPRESLYVIDGFLDNNTILAIKEHTTDTEGYTEHIFALCFLLGVDFMPRIKDLKIQQLYKVDKNISYGEIDALLTKTVNLDTVEEQIDEMVRIVASLKSKLAPAHEVLRRLSSGAPSDKISKAFTNLGRLIKTEYILRYITDPELRGRVQRQLNKGEHRHALSRWIFFADQGKFQTGDYEEIMNKASCLSLVSNAVLYWNTVKMSWIVDQLKANGEDISDKTLSHISLLPHRHVVPMGTYFVDEDFRDE
jgi:TnpA family transposase